MYLNVERRGSPFAKPYTIHRFVWECFNGFVPENGVIEHIDNNERNNDISNLQLVSQTDNEYYKLENDAIEEILNKEEYHKFENDLIEEIVIEI